jgi:hypothetical protein
LLKYDDEDVHRWQEATIGWRIFFDAKLRLTFGKVIAVG